MRRRPPFYKQYVDAARSRPLGLPPDLYGWLEMLRAAYWDCHSCGRFLPSDPRAIGTMLQRDKRAVECAINKLVALGRLEISDGAIEFPDLAEQLAEFTSRGLSTGTASGSGETSTPTSTPTSGSKSPPKSAANVSENVAKSAQRARPHARASQNQNLDKCFDSEKMGLVFDDDDGGAGSLARIVERAQTDLWRRDEREWLKQALPKFVRDDRGLRAWLANLELTCGADALTRAIASARPYVETGDVQNVQGYITRSAQRLASGQRTVGGLQ